MRIDPPPSPPVARLTSPPATAAADPPDEPPTVRPWRHGLWVTPLIFVTLTLSPPNSLAVVLPDRHDPAALDQALAWCDVYVAMRSLNTSDASVHGQPATGSSSLMPVGTPPNGQRHVGRGGRPRAPSGSR